MSLYTSLQLIKDVSHSLSPRNRGNEIANELVSSIRFHSPKPINQKIPDFNIMPMNRRLLLTRNKNNSN
ncbi:hypothetical protein SteCoe_20314 [Stentor coeruleus]|uniref:Uncharacterized protein n=1 Tax=Stentor coeruleus TaxID=5963 RepID=A0A1R2BSJ8_9CILI|nr:hypothetical protein SteCoe_20314 [Stentor coeruleus]